MIARVVTATVSGLDAQLIEVEADVTNGLPATIVVGLPDTAVQESRERVKSAIKNSACSYPSTHVSVNLAPADVQKIGTLFDLPIALAILIAAEQIAFDPYGKLFVGELSLDGTVKPVPGVLAIALLARQIGIAELYVPEGNSKEAALVSGLQIYAVSSLSQLLGHLLGSVSLQAVPCTEFTNISSGSSGGSDMADVAGHDVAKRALEIAASGGHNVLLYGPPGSGKTLLARSMVGILPDLDVAEVLELTKIYSIAGKLNAGSIVTQRPVRSPHHTTSNVALVGGGAMPRPGEITLAHRGILFLDEFPEFPRSVLEALRQPLEDGVVTVSRAKNTFTFPAKFILVAALNPCPCGYYGDSSRRCMCTPAQIFKYQKKISGPLSDRIDLHIEVPRLDYEKMTQASPRKRSEQFKTQVEEARRIQRVRFGDAKTNSEMNIGMFRKFCVLDPEGQILLKNAVEKYSLSGRSIHRLLKVSRTIADLSSSPNILPIHLAEAIQYRPKQD